MPLKAQTTIEKKKKHWTSKLKRFCISKGNVKKVKRQSIAWVFSSHISDTGLVSVTIGNYNSKIER